MIPKRYVELPLECRTGGSLATCLGVLSRPYRSYALSMLVHIHVRVGVHVHARSLSAKLDLANRVDFAHGLASLGVLDYS